MSRRTKHVLSMTYAPKIPAVLDGRCTQTIRKGRGFAVGDSVLIHSWQDKAYRSPWVWGDKVGKGCGQRVTITEVINIHATADGFLCTIPGNDFESLFTWDELNKIAELDFIEKKEGKSHGECLRDVLFGLNGAPEQPEPYQIIRWDHHE